MSRVIKSPTGIRYLVKDGCCALRMLMNIDPEVQRSRQLIVYGGSGKAENRRNGCNFQVTILEMTKHFNSVWKTRRYFRSHIDAPRVLIANSNWWENGQIGSI